MRIKSKAQAGKLFAMAERGEISEEKVRGAAHKVPGGLKSLSQRVSKKGKKR